MTARTRYFVIASLLVLIVGLGTGVVVYYLGVPSLGLLARTGPAELRYLPRDSAVVAYANVRGVMASAISAMSGSKAGGARCTRTGTPSAARIMNS